MKKLIIDLSKNIQDIIIDEDTNVYALLVPEENAIYKSKFDIKFKNSGLSAKIKIKIVLLGKAEIEFEPTIVVPKELIGINCVLNIECLTDTDESRLKITPSMEVSNPNIKTKHSLTISTFDENQMNYLLSRGLAWDESRKLLIDAFIGDIIKNIEE